MQDTHDNENMRVPAIRTSNHIIVCLVCKYLRHTESKIFPIINYLVLSYKNISVVETSCQHLF
jgi:hypothetical protein